MERRMKKNLHLAPVKKMHIRWWSNPQKKSRWYKLYKDLGKIVVCPEDLPWIYMLFATFFSWRYINTGTLNLGIREQPTQYQRKKLYVKQTNVKIGELWIVFPFTFTVWRASEYLPKLIFWIILECFKWTHIPFKGNCELNICIDIIMIWTTMNNDGSQYFLFACMEFLTWPLRNLRGACCFPPAWNERTLAQQQNQWDLINMFGWKCFGLRVYRP